MKTIKVDDWYYALRCTEEEKQVIAKKEPQLRKILKAKKYSCFSDVYYQGDADIDGFCEKYLKSLKKVLPFLKDLTSLVEFMGADTEIDMLGSICDALDEAMKLDKYVA